MNGMASGRLAFSLATIDGITDATYIRMPLLPCWRAAALLVRSMGSSLVPTICCIFPSLQMVGVPLHTTACKRPRHVTLKRFCKWASGRCSVLNKLNEHRLKPLQRLRGEAVLHTQVQQ